VLRAFGGAAGASTAPSQWIIEGKVFRAGGTWAFALLLAACAGQKPETVNPNIYPANFKTALTEFVRNFEVDAPSIRNAFVAEPVLKPVAADTRYVACVRYEAKDAEGHYTGSHDHAAIFFAGALNQYIAATLEQCAGAAYQPFPELQSLKRMGQ
jgi:hypothetical protein